MARGEMEVCDTLGSLVFILKAATQAKDIRFTFLKTCHDSSVEDEGASLTTLIWGEKRGSRVEGDGFQRCLDQVNSFAKSAEYGAKRRETGVLGFAWVTV